jgi:pimeloyl-ACP methyl ester carboxylesterase
MGSIKKSVWVVSVLIALGVMLSACKDTTRAVKPDQQFPITIPLEEWRQQAQFVQLLGHRIAYWQAGPKDKPVVLLIHGFPSAAWDWQGLWQPLSQGYRVVALDLLGFGYSDKPKDHAYSLIEQADIVMALTRQLGIERFHLLAHDYGVSVAQELLARHGDQVKEPVGAAASHRGFLLSLGLLNGGLFAETQNHNLVMTLMNSAFGPWLVKLADEESFSARFAAVFGDQSQPTEQQLQSYWQLINEQQGVLVQPELIGYIDERYQHRDRWVESMQATTVPMRIIVGAEDSLSGDNVLQRYRELIANADGVRLPGVGHYPQLEATEEVLASYQEFLSNSYLSKAKH